MLPRHFAFLLVPLVAGVLAWSAYAMLAGPPAAPTPSPPASPDTASAYVRVNQVGYQPEDAKVAIALSPRPIEGAFQLVDGEPQGLGPYQSASTGLANLAGRYAAAMAMAYRIWKDKDPAFAARCLRAAREVYRLGRAHEGVQQGNSYGAPYRYAESTWADDMEWGAAALYEATGEEPYLTDARCYAREIGNHLLDPARHDRALPVLPVR